MRANCFQKAAVVSPGTSFACLCVPRFPRNISQPETVFVSHPLSAGRDVEYRDRAVVRGPLALADGACHRHRAAVDEVLSGSLSDPEQHQPRKNPNRPTGSLSAPAHGDPTAIRSRLCALAPMSPVSSSPTTGARWAHHHAARHGGVRAFESLTRREAFVQGELHYELPKRGAISSVPALCPAKLVFRSIA